MCMLSLTMPLKYLYMPYASKSQCLMVTVQSMEALLRAGMKISLSGSNTKKGTLSEQFVTHVALPLSSDLCDSQVSISQI